MCMACQEMDLYYAYLDWIAEEEKRRAQPWQCEVTLFPAADEAATPEPAAMAQAVPAAAKPSRSKSKNTAPDEWPT